jgi:transposase
MARYKVTLTKIERDELSVLLTKGKHSSQLYRNACILLNCDCGEFGSPMFNEQIAQFLQINVKSVERLKQRFVHEGFESCLERKSATKADRKKVDGDMEAHLIALSCSKAPDGYARWSLRLLADKMIELEYAEEISHETVRQILKKTSSSLGK